MIINVEKWIVRDKDSHHYDIISYKIKKVEYCCDEIKQITNIDLYYTSPENNPNDEDRYSVGLMLRNTEYFYSQYESIPDATDTYYIVKFCPCCGKLVMVNVIGEVDKTEEYKALTDERDDIHKQTENTDSIKKKNILDRKQRELDRAIEKYYNTDYLDREEDNE